jgi:hypothetical protein
MGPEARDHHGQSQVHEDEPSTDGTLQLREMVRRLSAGGNRIRTIGPALVKGLSAVADERCRQCRQLGQTVADGAMHAEAGQDVLARPRPVDDQVVRVFRYWISSITELRYTTDPGVVARFLPTANFLVSTCAGRPPLRARSPKKFSRRGSRLDYAR